MKRLAWVLLALASCSSGAKKEETPRASTEPKMEIDPKTAEPIRTHELGTDRLRPAAKTLEWSNRSTADSAVYLGGEVVVDKIFREDAEDFFSVRVRLGNRSGQVVKFEYRILFTDRDGTRLLGIEDGYRPALLEPRGVRDVSDACRGRGATDFQLFVRAAGSKEEGTASNPPVKSK